MPLRSLSDLLSGFLVILFAYGILQFRTGSVFLMKQNCHLAIMDFLESSNIQYIKRRIEKIRMKIWVLTCIIASLETPDWALLPGAEFILKCVTFATH